MITKGQDALAEARDLLQEPSRDTKRKILVATNLIVGIVITLHVVIQLATKGHMPVPERDNVIFPLILVINFGSASYNGSRLLRRGQGSAQLDALTAWTTVIFLQLVALTLIHSSSNTALSMLGDMNFSIIMIFYTGFILNRRVAVVWFIIVLVSLFVAIKNRGPDFEFVLMTSDELARLNALGSTSSVAYMARTATAAHEKIVPISITLVGVVCSFYSLFGLLGTYFEAGMIGQVLKAIPNAIDKIQIASEERQKLEQENVRMGAELDVAQRIQAMILPKEDELKKCRGLDVAAKMVPASEVGGDLYDVLPQKDGSTALVIGDVTDHGLASGLVMLMAQSALRLCLEEAHTDLLKALQFLNNMLYKNVQTRMHDSRTLTLSLLHYKDGLVRLAGQHESVVILRKGQSETEEIETGDLGTVVGMIDDIEPMVAETSFRLDPGDCMLLYTDGATEAENPKQEQYGIERVKQSVLRSKGKAASEVVDAIFTDLMAFIDTAHVHDDITLVVIRAR
jgi:serine phosphatase RsbU (regulator of sigma subunit)